MLNTAFIEKNYKQYISKTDADDTYFRRHSLEEDELFFSPDQSKCLVLYNIHEYRMCTYYCDVILIKKAGES